MAHLQRYLIAFIPVLLLTVSVLAEPRPVQTVEFDAPGVGCKMHYNVILPAGYDESDKRYPVLYLLHGRSGNYKQWAELCVPEYAVRYELIVVMPDAGNSFYINWAKSEEGQKNDWGDYIVKDLIGQVDQPRETSLSPSGRGNPWSRMDQDDDGKISRDEAQGLMKANFDRVDLDNDGLVDKEELDKLAARLNRGRSDSSGRR